jgi:hypothetical protein
MVCPSAREIDHDLPVDDHAHGRADFAPLGEIVRE